MKLPTLAKAPQTQINVFLPALRKQHAGSQFSVVTKAMDYDDDDVAAHILTKEWGVHTSLASYDDLAPAPSHRGGNTTTMAMEMDSDITAHMLTKEWGPNMSLASYDDLLSYVHNKLNKARLFPMTRLIDIISTNLITIHPNVNIREAHSYFDGISGLPVIDDDGALLGVLSKKDLSRPGQVVADIMSSPAIVAHTTSTVEEAAIMMLKYKVHRLPVMNKAGKLAGIITRTDVFTAMAMDTGSTEMLDF
jgi:CBS domain-containing protein